MKIEIGKKYVCAEMYYGGSPLEYIAIVRTNPSGTRELVGDMHFKDGATNEGWSYDTETGELLGLPEHYTLIAEYKEGTTAGKVFTTKGWKDGEFLVCDEAGCNHEYVNVGFATVTMACKRCGQGQ